eukprot:scaffold44040_cov69-Phaeocystis_antarctica.AAC.3
MFARPARQHAPLAPDQAQGGLRPRPASARLGRPRPVSRLGRAPAMLVPGFCTLRLALTTP